MRLSSPFGLIDEAHPFFEVEEKERGKDRSGRDVPSKKIISRK
jgi:hypothetical protein